MKTNPQKTTRRRFLATAAAAVSAPTIIPASALGRNGRPAPSERINIGAIGFGTIAYVTVPGFMQDERVQLTAIADPVKDMPNYGYRAEKRGGRLPGKEVVDKHYGNSDCKTYVDFREMIEKEDLDAINVSSPDHWHAYMAIYGARKGLHIYGQKPLALTVDEGRRMSDEIAKAGVTWQTGSQQRSDIYFRMACEFVRNGRLGKLEGVDVFLPGGHKNWSNLADRQSPEEAPDGILYDLWEGPARHRPYIPALLPLNWRHNYDYSGGMVTDFGAHHVDIAQWALGMDETGPVKFEGITGDVPDVNAIYNTATSFEFTTEYANGTRMHVMSTDRSPRGEKDQGILFKGENGKSIFVKRGSIEFNPRELAREKIQDNEIRLYSSNSHESDFVDGVYSGGATAAPIEAAHRSISIGHLANIGLRTGIKDIQWDPAKEISTNDEVNAMLARPMREPYSI
ncbi:MAG: Gfo/Idh/MocA family oxidoreductase [Verrucomicrobiota bacterium]